MLKDEFPSAVDIEKKLLSAMMLKDGAAIPDVIELVAAEDFYRPQHRLIYQALLDIYNRGTPPDVLLVEEELRKNGKLRHVEHSYLFSLIDMEYSTARATFYANTIKSKALMRRLVDAGNEIAQEANNEDRPIAEVLERAEQKILSVTSRATQTKFESLKEIVDQSYERISTIQKNPDAVYGVPTGLHDLDEVTNGFQKSDLLLLAARPSMGKTALALNMAIGAARRGKVVAVFSLEMSKAQLANRLLSLETGIDSQRLNTGHLSSKDMDDLMNATNRLGKLELYIDDTAGISLINLRTKVRRLKHDVGLDFVVLDYLQLMQGTRTESRQQEISEISRSLKSLARELDVPILALSQLSRNVELRAEKKPQLSDLRESGSLEQDADIVMFLYREEYYNRDDAEKANVAEVIFAKNRNGPTTSIMLQFQKETMRFGDLLKEKK